MNQRNKPKLAVIVPNRKPLDRWYLWNDGLVGALRTLAKKFNIRVFGFCDAPAYFPKDGFVVQLFDNETSMRYWLKSFSPRHVIGYGECDTGWEELLDRKYLALENQNFVLGLNTKGLGPFSTHETFYATDTETFKPLQANKLYPCVFTLPLENLEQIAKGSLCIVSDGTNFQDVIKNKHLVLTAPKTPLLFNQTLGVITNDTETALDAMACNTPVLTTDIDIEGCWRCPKDEIGEAYFQMVVAYYAEEQTDIRRNYIVGKADHHALAERIQGICLQKEK